MSTSPYRELILAHNKAPNNRGALDPCDAEVTLHNPLCGDRVTLRVRLASNRIAVVRFEARGCAICIASASMLTDEVGGSTTAAAAALARRLIDAVNDDASRKDLSEDLLALADIHRFRARRRCATLAWEALIELVAVDPVGRL